MVDHRVKDHETDSETGEGAQEEGSNFGEFDEKEANADSTDN
jgi:hypothetical protein